jgi:hypothetical protein
MALRVWSKRVGVVALRAPRTHHTSPRFASASSAALQGSSLPQDVKDSIAVGTQFIVNLVCLLTPRSVNRLFLHLTRPRAPRPLASSTSSSRIWFQHMYAHHQCSRRVKDAICGIWRTESILTSPLALLSMHWAIVTQALRKC